MNAIIRTLFFLSAIAPAVVLSAVAQFYKQGGSTEIYGWIAAGALACLFPFLVIRAAAIQTEELAFSAKKIDSQDWLLVVFVVSYFIPLITKLEDMQMSRIDFRCCCGALGYVGGNPMPSDAACSSLQVLQSRR